MRVLVAEDNSAFAKVIQERLHLAAISSDHVATIAAAEQALAAIPYAALILDLGMPDGDGVDLVRRLRAVSNSIPILIISARHGLDDRLVGLRAGADDYLAKPFSVDELIARLRAIARRAENVLGEVLRAGNVSLDTQSRQVNIGPHIHAGRLRETLILEILLRYSGQVVKRDFLFNQLYGFDAKTEPATVDVHIHRLRRHLADRGATVIVHTIRGVGFMLTAQQPSAALDRAC
jgi:two-component system response regulator TctD